MREGIAFLSFTDRGAELAQFLSGELGGTAARTGDGISLCAWTKEHFPCREALVFIGAAGIAVRAIAPYVRSKAEDAAVLCVDEYGRYVIPLLSGHLGGANETARRIAALTGGEAVITTATDLNGVFAVDLWAKKQGMVVYNPGRIKMISGRLLRGGTVTFSCSFPIRGEMPAGIAAGADGDILVSFRKEKPGEETKESKEESKEERKKGQKEERKKGQKEERKEALRLVPRVLTLGIGCRRGISAEALEAAFADFCSERGILPQAVSSAASIDLKQSEPGLLEFCAMHGWLPVFYSAEELGRVDGDFTASAFVQSRTGVDNICERAAVLLGGGILVEKKYAAGGVTFALAQQPAEFDWSV